MTTNPPPANETELERWQRNFAELLQELRVAQTGVQILFAFLLILAFTSDFAAADGFSHTVYLVALLATAAATALLIAPVAIHRLQFRRQRKPQIVVQSHRIAYAGLLLVIVSMVSAVLLAADVILARPVAIAVAAGTGVWFALFWGILPLLNRRSEEVDAS